MKARWKILMVAGIFLIAIFAAFLVSMHIQPPNEVDAYKKSLIAQGEKLEINEVLPAPVPAESNGVMLVEQAFSLFTPSGDEWTNWPPMMRMTEPGKAIVEFEQPDVRASDYTNSWDNVIAAAKEQAPALELLKQAAIYPAIDFQLDYKQGATMPIRHLAAFKRCSLRLSASAMCDLHNGDRASAVTNLCALLAILHADSDERTIISQLVRIAMASIASETTWEVLQTTNMGDKDLAALQKSWEQINFIEPVKNSILMERAIAETTISKMRSSKEEYNKIMGLYSSFGRGSSGTSSSSGDWWEDLGDSVKAGVRKAQFAGATFMWQTSWTYSDELQTLKQDQNILETLRQIQTNQFFNPSYSNMMNQLYPAGSPSLLGDVRFDLDDLDLRHLFSSSSADLTATIRKTMAAEANKRIVINAIALKRYQLKHGRFPENLAELAPDFLSSVPLDPVDGNPLRYHRNADGTFLLYSIGEDGVDDGGNPSPVVSSTTFYWLRGRDWVWPQPATEAEIKYFYEHPPK